MKNNFDLKGYMKENKVGAYQQLNEMWYQDINQALGDFNTMKEVEEREPEYNKELEEMGGVKTIGDAGKMATPNSRPNLGRHRSSDMLDKMSKKDHKTNTVVGAKAAAYKAPHMKEEETADDIFAGSDTADFKDNYGNDTSEWDTEIAGQTVNGWTADETQGGSISWQNPKYPHTIVYATPGWEGVNGIALEVYSDPEDGWTGPLGPMMQKVIGAHTDLWKTEKGYLALMDKAFTALEMKLTPSEEMDEDHGTQIDHDKSDNISKDPSEFEDTVYEGIQDYNHTFEEDIMDLLDDGVSKPEILTHFTDILKIARPRMGESIENEDADPFGSIKTGIDKITQGDDEDMSDDDRFDQLGGDKIKAGIESLMGDGFDFREILQFVKDTIAAKRNF